jgi:hypothetical protein
MAISALSREQFEARGVHRVGANGRRRQTVEWFADDTGVLLGTVAYYECPPAWSFTILGRDRDDAKFHLVHVETGCLDLDQARRRLFEQMDTVLAAGHPPASVASARP